MDIFITFSKAVVNSTFTFLFFLRLMGIREERKFTAVKWLGYTVLSTFLIMIVRSVSNIYVVTLVMWMASVLYFLFLYKLQISKVISGVFLSIAIFLLVNTICMISAFAVNYITVKSKDELVWTGIQILLSAICTGFLLFKREFSERIRKLFDKTAKPIAYIFSAIVLVLYAAVGITTIAKEFYALLIFAVAVILLFILILLWYHNEEKNRQHMEELFHKIQDLVASQHKDKEILPALQKQIEELNSRLGKGSEVSKELSADIAAELQELEEVYHDRLREERRAFMHIKGIPETGSYLLTNQLMAYAYEAENIGVTFDVVVEYPISFVLEKKFLTRLQLQRLFVNLIRNAFRAIERKHPPASAGEEEAGGHEQDKPKARDDDGILICMGLSDADTYDIDIYDSGAYFDRSVLEALGKKGNTTGGTGHGYPELLGLLEESGASYILTEFAPGSDLYTKQITITFDGRRRFETVLYNS